MKRRCHHSALCAASGHISHFHRTMSVRICKVYVPKVVRRQRFGVRMAVLCFFPTITMPDHRYTNGQALAFQGASIKQAKKSSSRWGEIHFVPGSNICCSRPSQKDARIKPKSPLIYCNDRQTDRQAERMTICGKRAGKGKRQKQLLSRCLSFWAAHCMYVSAPTQGGSHGKGSEPNDTPLGQVLETQSRV